MAVNVYYLFNLSNNLMVKLNKYLNFFIKVYTCLEKSAITINITIIVS